jgi:hypothetical protein
MKPVPRAGLTALMYSLYRPHPGAPHMTVSA